MKTILVCTVCVGAIASSVLAEGERRPEGEKFPDGKRPHRENVPGDEEGRRGKPPFGGPGEMFKRMDSNNDGNITKEEFFAAGRLEKLPEDKREKLFSRLDRDGDGQIGKEEIRAMRKDAEQRAKQEFHDLDKDKDGGLDFEEFSAGNFIQKLPEEKRREIFARMDTDGDGHITPKDRPERRRRPEQGEERPHRPEPPLKREKE